MGVTASYASRLAQRLDLTGLGGIPLPVHEKHSPIRQGPLLTTLKLTVMGGPAVPPPLVAL